MIAEASILDNGLIQLGFAGFCLILLSLLFWTIKQLISLTMRADKVMAKLTEALNSLGTSLLNQMANFNEEQKRLSTEVRDLTETVKYSINKSRGN